MASQTRNLMVACHLREHRGALEAAVARQCFSLAVEIAPAAPALVTATISSASGSCVDDDVCEWERRLALSLSQQAVAAFCSIADDTDSTDDHSSNSTNSSSSGKVSGSSGSTFLLLTDCYALKHMVN